MAAIASLPASTFPHRARSYAPTRRPSDTVLVSVPPLVRHPFALPGRLLATVALAAVGLLALATLALSPAITPGAEPAVAGTHVVEAGESMWSIALDQAPAGEAAGYVEHLVELNGSASVVPGQVVTLPRS